MIDCPICHVMNEDMARFCAECGQRLTRQSPQAAAGSEPAPPPVKPEPAKPADPQPKAPKLHSPLLGAEQADYPSHSGKPDLSRLRGTSSPASGSADTGSGGHMGLRSPLLGGVDPGLKEDSPSHSASGGHLGLRSPLLGGVDPGQSREPEPPSPRSGKKAHLHSPLLEGDDEDVYEDAPPSRPAGKRKLKSPLLSGDDDDYPQPQRQSASGGLRSPLLSGNDSDSDQHSGRSASGKHHLRSPLLGGQDDDDDFEEPPRPVGRSAGLRSPILGSAETVPMGRGSAFVEIDDEEEGGDHHLRSPLLASKVQMHDKPAAPKSQKSEAQPARPSAVEHPAGAEMLSHNQTGGEQSWGGPAAPATPPFGGPSPAAPPPFPQATATEFSSPPPPRPPAIPPQAVNPADSPLRSALSPNAPSSHSEAQAGRRFGSEPPGPGPARPEGSASSGLPGGLAGSPMSANVPSQNKPMAGPGALLGPAMAPNFDEPVGSNADSAPAYSGLSGFGQPAPPAPSQTPPVNLSGLRSMGTNTAHDESDTGSKKRRFKALEETEPVVQETHERHTAGPNRFSGQSHAPAPQAAALPGFVKILALPLLFAAIMKALVLMDWLKTPQTPFTVIGDQIGQLLVCISLIIICVSAGNSRS